jgi:hypothetical protein
MKKEIFLIFAFLILTQCFLLNENQDNNLENISTEKIDKSKLTHTCQHDE